MILRGSISNWLAGETSAFWISSGSTMPLPSAAPTWGAALEGSALISAAALTRPETESLYGLRILGGEGAGNGDDRAGLTGEDLLAASDQLDLRVAALDNRQGRLADAAAIDGAGQDRLLRRVDAHRHDLDIGLVDLRDLQSQYCSVVLGTEPAGWVARRASLPLAARKALNAAAAVVPG